MHRAMVFKARQTRPTMGLPMLDPFAHDRFLFNPKLLSFGYEYVIDDEVGHHLMLVVKRAFSLALHVKVFADEACTQRLLTVRQDSPWQFFVNDYTVYDGAGQPIAAIRRDPLIARALWSSFRGSRFSVTDNRLQPAAVAEPEFDLLGYNWQINAPNGAMLGRWSRRLALTDKHTLDLSADVMRSFNRRIAVALGILLDFACR